MNYLTKATSWLTLLYALCAFAAAATAQRMPTGEYHRNRERSVDIRHYRAELSFDFENLRIYGTATVRLAPLRSISTIEL